MALQALKIVTEEIARTRANWDGRVIPPDALDGLEARITVRIETECIEVPEPDFDLTKDDHVSLSQLLREDPDIPF